MRNSKYKKNVLVAVGVALVLGAGFFVFSNFIDNEKQQNETLSQLQREALASSYIEENISQLSPESEVLGGTFYVTNIVFTGENSGTVEYEDGHIALVADFEYAVNEEGDVEIELVTVDEASE